jgi:hypothetical protein
MVGDFAVLRIYLTQPSLYILYIILYVDSQYSVCVTNNSLYSSGLPFRQRNALLAQADKDGDGKIDLDEFRQFLRICSMVLLTTIYIKNHTVAHYPHFILNSHTLHSAN